ncbi:hypothetical protein K7395_17055 [Streptomyces filamentosus]|uniref:Integral membrane protein n=2 Tax=Streptomyces filamentosus TaxID=67294 RepID=A0ABY4V245_STRFL|nr:MULTISPECIES: hypothetical protein [Streptomyces]ESU48240.1 hypothetical protein P376_3784 [Streptomyces sp. HCCB10043]MYR80143.1 hypothetical protein [Streptomyces sp. SID5466]USC48321.1 hypothetical protein K7395_17055 [Streptomyces filamentosus]
METSGGRPTPEQAHFALADTEHIRASVAALSATPWPNWFFATLTLYLAALPIAYGGVMADEDWLLTRPVWMGIMVAITALYVALLAVAAKAWREKTGVALRLDVLPKRATAPLAVGLPSILVGSAFAFRFTGWPGWLLAASVIGAAASVGFHLAFVRLHRASA